MSKSPAKSAPADPLDADPFPFKPRRVLFWVLLSIFFIWIGWLLYLYFTVVRAGR
jgi:hypothetical protein